MGALSIWHVLVLAAVALLLFGGGGKISDLMSDLAKGITSFKKGLAESEDSAPRDKAPFRAVDDTAPAFVAVAAADGIRPEAAPPSP